MRAIILTLLLLISSICRAQPVAITYANNIPALFFDKPDVLQHAGVKWVNSIFKDSRGLMWLSTENGLYRFDGTNVIVARNKIDDPHSLPDNMVYNVAEDKQGRIWVGTDAGPAIIDPNTLYCTRVADDAGHYFGFKFYVTVDAEGTVWANSDDGLFRYDEQKKWLKSAWHVPVTGKYGGGFVMRICFAKDGQLVFTTQCDVVLFNKKDNSYVRLPLPEEGHQLIPTIPYIDNAGELWVGTFQDGLLHYNTGTKKFDWYKCMAGSKDLPGNGICQILKIKTGNKQYLFLATSDGLLRLPLMADGHTPVVSSNGIAGPVLYTNDIKNDGSITEHSVNTLLQDEQGMLWVGSSATVAVARTRPGDALFTVLPIACPGVSMNIDTVTIGGRSVHYATRWHGDGGLLLLDGQLNLQHRLDRLPADNGGDAVDITAVVRTDKGQLWASSWDGITIMNDALQPVNKITWKKGGNNGLSSSKPMHIMAQGDSVWVSAFKYGVDLYRSDGTKLQHYSISSNKGLREDLIWRFFHDTKGNVWLLGDAYLYRYCPVGDSFATAYFSADHSMYKPFDMASMKDGSVLVATHKGLVRYDGYSKYSYITAPAQDGEDNVNSVCTDDHDNVWYLTDEHLISYNPTSKQFATYGAAEGLDPAARLCRLHYAGDNRFLIGTDGKLILFNAPPDVLHISPPGIIINSVTINDSTVPGTALQHSGLSLPFNKNRISIEFACINYNRAEQNLFAYRLNGADTQWHYTSKGYLMYPDLQPGNYVFEVKAANYAKVWSNVTSISIHIAPPYWKTVWFRLLATIFIIFLLIFIIRYVVTRNLRERILRLEKEQAVEKERNRIARDVHDDLGSGLTKIAIMSEVAKQQVAQPQKIAKQLEDITTVSRELVDNLQDIIWVLDTKNDTLESLAAYLAEYGRAFFENFDIEAHFDFPETFPVQKLSEEQRRNLFLIVKECYNNIGKHAGCQNVWIHMQLLNRRLYLTIKDDGCGFDPESTRRYGNGLRNMQDRMAQLKGRLEITSKPGDGTYTAIEMPL